VRPQLIQRSRSAPDPRRPLRSNLRPRAAAPPSVAAVRIPGSDSKRRRLACAALLLLAIAFGGGTAQGLFGDWIVDLAALALLAWLVWNPSERARSTLARAGLAWCGLAAVAVLLQCIPLPASWWSALGGRSDVAAELAQAGVATGAHALSFNPYATERLLGTLLAPAAVFALATALPDGQRLDLIKLLFVLVMLSVLLGLAQVAGGSQSPLRFYEVTNPTEAVGFFANRNHYGALLYAMLPLALAWLGASLAERNAGGDVPPLLPIALGAFLALLILGLVLTRSRAGLFIGMLAIAGGIVVAATSAPRTPGRSGVARGVALAALLGLVVAVQYGLYGIIERLQTDPAEDARWTLLGVTLKAADAFGHWGTGYGTFVNVYQSFETPAIMFPQFVNHAHNDWAEAWLEGGWIAAVLGVLLLAWLATVTLNTWRRRAATTHVTAMRRAAALSLALMLAHEFVDYALRTTALLCVFALLAAVAAGNGERVPRAGRVDPRLRRTGA